MGDVYCNHRHYFNNNHHEEEEACLEVYHDLDFSVPSISNTYEIDGLKIIITQTHFYINKETTATDSTTTTTTTTGTCSSEFAKKQAKLLNHLNERSQRRQKLELTKERYQDFHNASEQLSCFLQEIPDERHGMALGAYLAGVYRGDLSTRYLKGLYDFATDNLRYIVLDDETLLVDGWRDYVTNWTTYLSGDPKDLKRAFTLSKPLPPTERIDYFISHCWSDSGRDKADAMMRISCDFQERHGRLPRLWLDMFCMPQTGNTIEKNVAALPLFLKACDMTAVLLSDALLSRLWCLVEIYTAYILSPRDGKVEFQLYPIQDMTERLGNRTSKSAIWIEDARCGLKSDQDLLFRNLKDAPSGLEGVESGLNVALKLPYVWINRNKTDK